MLISYLAIFFVGAAIGGSFVAWRLRLTSAKHSQAEDESPIWDEYLLEARRVQSEYD